MWISRKVMSKTTNNTEKLLPEKSNIRTKATAFIIDSINKPLPPINNTVTLEPLTFVVVGGSNVGKSTFIRFALQNLIPKQRQDFQYHHTTINFDNVNCPIDIIELDDSQLNILPTIHGSLVCYDLTNRDSFDCIPDLLNYCLSRNIPTYLVGLKSDQTASFQIDQSLIQKIVDLFTLDHFQVDTFSEKGVDQMKQIFKLLVTEHHHELTTGFIYAPTKTEHFSTTSADNADPDRKLLEKDKRGTKSSFTSFTRRGSKDSCESFGIGLTAEDIIDRLLSTENNKTDENIIPVFLAFYRKFMKPYSLVKILVERFKNDGLSPDSLPSKLQKRIHNILSLWLSNYWNDFTSPYARKHVILFIDDISKFEHFTPICDCLAPLVIREPPTNDPDQGWGLVDDEEDLDDGLSWPSTPVSPTSRSFHRKRNEKKDSAYSSGIFSVASYESTSLASPIREDSIFMKRTSTNSSYLVPKSPISETRPHNLSPNVNNSRLLRSKTVTHVESQPDLKSTYTTHKSPVLKENCEAPRRTEFAGGLINIDDIVKQQSNGSSINPSITSGRWTSSFGQQILASSFISTFRQHKSDKHQSSYNYKILTKTSEKSFADQLTWIEYELFSRIKPREFLRNIWSSTLNGDKFSSNNTVTASVTHFNFISAWVITMVITQSSLSKRVTVLLKFMSIAVELRNRNNYNSLMAILAGINNASILRLKQTRQVIETKKIYKRFQSLERLMSSDRSYSSYRLALKTSGTPGIPYLGIHNQDLVSLVEANKDFRVDGTIHWEKFRLMGETIMSTMKFKYPGYNIEPDSKVLTFIADSFILSEDEQYKRSILIEPRLASTNNNIIRNLWLRM